VWPGQPMTAHWGLPDPAAVEGTDVDKANAFRETFRALERRIGLFTRLPFASLDRLSLRPEPARSARPDMSTFERYLTALGRRLHRRRHRARALPAGRVPGHRRAEIAKVNLPVAVLIWLMIIPMLMKIDFAALGGSRAHWRGIGVTLFVNWAVKPFSMALLGWLFIGWLFRPWLPADQIDSYIAGLILLAAAPCTAMVFVWSNLSEGEPHFTLSQVALNDVIMVFAFAPIVGLLLGLSAITVPWDTLLLSVVLYIVVPVWHRAGPAQARCWRGGSRAPARRCAAAAAERSWRCSRRSCCCSASRASRSSNSQP
jgi:hypothetical protein